MIHIVQCLCPARHCIIAAVYDPADVEDGAPPFIELVKAQAQEFIDSGAINPWSGLCGARVDQWRYEDGVTKYRTLEEARPHMEACAGEQSVTREALQAAARAMSN